MFCPSLRNVISFDEGIHHILNIDYFKFSFHVYIFWGFILALCHSHGRYGFKRQARCYKNAMSQSAWRYELWSNTLNVAVVPASFRGAW